jgi:hypothetical protein
MTDERTARETALDDATDGVIREMTHVELSDDAVTRVMARVRAARGTEQRSGGGLFGVLLAPRVSWGLAAATAALAAIVAAGVTLVAVRGDHGDHGPAATMAAKVTPPNPVAPVITPLRRAAAPGGGLGQPGGGPSSGSSGGAGQSVGAAMVMQPDEDPPRAQRVPPLPDGAVPQDVKLEITITDQSGAAKPVAKTVSLVVADREGGSVQSETRLAFPQRPVKPAPAVTGWDWQDLPLNVNVWPTIMADGHVRVKLMLNYRTAGIAPTSPDGPMATAMVKKDVTAVLSDGKPMVISTSADAATDRKVTVELKASIQK